MDTKWINKDKKGFKGFFKKLYLIEIVVILVLTIKIIPTLIDNVRYNGRYSDYKSITKMLFDSDNYKLKRLREASQGISGKIYYNTKGFKNLEDKYFKEKFKRQILTDPEYISDRVAVLIINNKTKETFTNREWLDDDIKKGQDGIQVIEKLCKTDNVKYYLANNVDTFNYLIENNPKYQYYYEGEVANLDKETLSNYTEVYFSRCEPYDSEINYLKIMLTLTIVLMLIDILLIIKWIFYYIKNKKGSLKSAITKDFLYLKILEFIACVKRIPIVIKRIRITVLDIIIFMGWFIYIFFIYTPYRAQRIDMVIGIYLNKGIATAIFIFYIILRYMYKVITKYDEMEKLIEDLNQIKSGDMNLSLDQPKDNQLKALVSGINEIKEGYKNSIEDGIKNEKLKTELISNVSHDLRTPLTSIINYVDILKRNDITEEERSDYIKVVENKSNKLKKLIDDLFEISKMNSGKIEINREEVDIIQLLYQSIGEMTDDRKELDFNVEAPESIIMEVDGYRMSRVFQNIVSNSIKYSLDNTRIYIKVEETKTRVIISFKNVANYEMKFKENEVLERFVRGDKSRNSEIEGSGLGLAIAKSIIELHDGKIKVEREGDMFKVYIVLMKPI
ncbi:Histidine kinase-, DNA gyrase B-, and HSP90-like ATPase [Clostridium cavendishii DSM 21758]|uniref:histidine kinase n=1 Tax=Clostridium cavendishii DSM 21758 TaxID=1121302 RepID=A0A1M6M281_9CLOT|nr:HAMP domain-containing sensor histidine kinase [Clostridium cavendishii]SHJ77433.1 Histidine kinase-, DNA gyrase B-, and HSP90-like ATPase [Clostridium cavendishii DSM 21758]